MIGMWIGVILALSGIVLAAVILHKLTAVVQDESVASAKRAESLWKAQIDLRDRVANLEVDQRAFLDLAGRTAVVMERLSAPPRELWRKPKPPRK